MKVFSKNTLDKVKFLCIIKEYNKSTARRSNAIKSAQREAVFAARLSDFLHEDTKLAD